MERAPRAGLWVLPLLFAALVAGVGAYAYRTLADATRASLRDGLQTILLADVAAIDLWAGAQEAVVRAAAQDVAVRASVTELVALERQSSSPSRALEALRQAPSRVRLRAAVTPTLREHSYSTYAVLGRDGVVLAASADDLVGRRLELDPLRLDRVLAGDTVIALPRPGVAPPGSDARDEAPVIHSVAPVRGSEGEPIAMLAFSIPAEALGAVLRVARTGESGETYAFDADGVLLSRSRFEDQLVAIGLLAQGKASILNVEVRDPGGNLTQGFQPTLPLRARPLTRMAAAAISGESGIDITGYPDYRGVPVVGAWIWLSELGMGVTTEIDVEEAFAGLATVRRSLAAIAGVLTLSALGMLAYSLALGRLRHRYERERQFGRYKLVELIGEGGMGKVYRAEHALLRRPTAVKLLESSGSSEEAVRRFEREVQVAASLTHPNTIAIYDYGRTPEGTFYYAMEYLDGITVGQLVAADGAQPEARAAHIIRQAAASLGEAHAAGLIHRDLKPSNLMLSARGGVLDFVKVLDFGLVRVSEDDLQLTSTQSLTGTPLYLSPEALVEPSSMDARSDVYQLGTILYYLLTGRPVFQGATLVEVLNHHLNSPPVPPSEVLGRSVSSDLEKLVLACLQKERELRPLDGAALLAALDACRVEGTWTQDDARDWWADWAREHPRSAGDGSTSAGSLPSGWQVDLAARLGGSGSRTRGS